MLARRTLLTIAFLLVSSVAPVASAQLSDADKATARALAQQGQDALDRKDFPTAADRFERARQLFPAPTLAVGLARAQVGLGKWIAAQETLNRVIRDGAPAGSPPAYAKAVAEAKKDLEVLEPRIPSVVIHVKGAPSPRVTLDGALLPNAVLGVNRLVDPGQHVVRAEAEGFAATQATVTVGERKAETVTLTLAPGQGAPPPVTPPPPTAPPPGTPPLKAGAAPPPPVVVIAPAPAGGSLRKTLGFVGIGVGGAALLMGAVTGGLAVPKHSELQSHCPQSHCPPGEYGTLDSFHLLSSLSTAGIVAGGVLAAAGVVLVVTAPRSGQTSGAWVAPVVGARFSGLEGRF